MMSIKTIDLRFSSLHLAETVVQELRRSLVFQLDDDYLNLLHSQDCFGRYWQNMHGDEHLEMFFEDLELHAKPKKSDATNAI